MSSSVMEQAVLPMSPLKVKGGSPVLTPKIAVLLSLVVPACCHAADKTEHADAAPVLIAGMGGMAPSIPGVAHDLVPSSAGVTSMLPDTPDFHPGAQRHPGAPLSFYLFRFAAAMDQTTEPSVEEPMEQKPGLESATFDDPSMMSLVGASPIGGAAHRIRADRFNTDDGSMMYDFAICYRLSKHSSVEVIPGDPAPVKIPVARMANNMGVTVGMVVRLNRMQ
jgi:hypothetical protein